MRVWQGWALILGVGILLCFSPGNRDEGLASARAWIDRTAMEVSVPVIGMRVWQAIQQLNSVLNSESFSPGNRDEGLARFFVLHSGSICTSFSPGNRDEGLASSQVFDSNQLVFSVSVPVIGMRVWQGRRHCLKQPRRFVSVPVIGMRVWQVGMPPASELWVTVFQSR